MERTALFASPIDSFAAAWRRREVLAGAMALFGAALLPVRLGRAAEEPARFELPKATRELLETSPYVYVSPLHPDGAESRCHGEVWFFQHEGDAILATARDGWKARAVRKGWRRARVWVGDHGRASKDAEKFRSAPTFLAEARLDDSSEAFEALMRAFAGKYSKEWAKWQPRFRKSHASGERVVIRYTPIGG